MREYSSMLDIINICLLVISNLFFSLIILKKWKGRLLDILVPIMYPLVCTMSLIYSVKYISIINEPSSYIVLFIMSLITLILLLKIGLEEAIFLSVLQAFHIIFAKSLSAGTMSLILKKNMFQLFQIEQYSQLISTLAYLIMAILFSIYFVFISKKKLQSFFLCKGQVSYVLIIHVLITIYLLFKSYNFYYNLDLIWFSVDQVYTSLILYIIYFLVLRFATRISSLLQNEIRAKNQSFKILNQMSVYLSYKEAGEFISLYKEKSEGLKVLINTDKKDEVLADINVLDKKVDTMTAINFKAISNIDIINALFYEFLTDCSFKEINATSDFFIPNTLSIKDKELHEVLSCLLKNSLEANLKIAEKRNRKININTEQKEDIFIIRIENTYEAKLRLYNGSLQTSKVYTEIEGLGVGYIMQTLEKIKGEFTFSIDEAEKIFKVEVSLKYRN